MASGSEAKELCFIIRQNFKKNLRNEIGEFKLDLSSVLLLIGVEQELHGQMDFCAWSSA